MARQLDSRPRSTPRFTLRPFRRRDTTALHEAITASQKDLQQWLPWAASYDRSVAQRFIRDSASAWAEGKAFDFAVRAKDDQSRHVGNVSVWWTSMQNGIGEIGYWIRSDMTGQGVGTEVTARAVQIGFEELDCHKLVLRIAVGNVSSEGIAQHLGFTYEGILRDEVKIGDEWVDHTAWSLLDNEWDELSGKLRADGVLA
jgi:ribosomal-protein-serine acetyltransferase